MATIVARLALGRWYVLAAVLVAAADLPAQQPVTVLPGSALLAPRCGVARADTIELVMSIADTNRQRLATLTRSRVVVPGDGGPFCVVVQQYDRAGAVDLDTAVLQAHTLAPLRYASRFNRTVQLFRFTRDSVVGSVTVADSPATQVALLLVEPLFNAVADLEVLAALPLTTGFLATFGAFNPPGRILRVSIEVAAAETVMTRGRPVLTWRVEYDAGLAPTTLWLDTTSHSLVRAVSRLPGGRRLWRLRPGDQPDGRVP